MKILYILHSLDMSGAAITFLNLLPELIKKGIEPFVIIPHGNHKNNKTEIIEQLDKLGVKYEKCNLNPLCTSEIKGSVAKEIYRKIRIIYRRCRSTIDLKRVIKLQKPNLIHTNTGVIQEGFIIAQKLGIPHLWHIREYQSLDFNWRFYPSEKKVREMYGRSYTAVITYDMQAFFGLKENIKSKVIYDALFSKSECKYEEEAGEKNNYFLIANRISPEKGITDIIEAFASFCRNNDKYELKIAGFGEKKYIETIKQKCEHYGILNKVKFLGFQKDVKPLMLHAKALIVGSYNEGFGMMTAEANMLGCPVIGRNSAGTKEILNNTKGGFLYDSISEMTKIMNQIVEMNDIEQVEFMKNPMEIAIDSYSIEKSASAIYDYYKEILSKNIKQRFDVC